MPDEKAPTHSRRKTLAFLTGGAGAFAAWAALGPIQSVVNKAVGPQAEEWGRRLWDWVSPQPHHLAEARQLFFGHTSSGIEIIPSYRAMPHEDVTQGFSRSTKLEMSEPTKFVVTTCREILALAGHKIVETSNGMVSELARNTLLLGGPVANPLVRDLMGVDGSSSVFFNSVTGQPLRFPWYFNLSRITATNYRTEDVSRSPSPDWILCDRGGAKPPIDLDKYGRPVEDHVLITSIPNVFDRNALKRGDRLTIFSGRHGVATRSMSLFLGNMEVTSPLLERSKAGKSWQAIVRVSRIYEDGQTPLELDPSFDYTELAIDFSNVKNKTRLVESSIK